MDFSSKNSDSNSEEQGIAAVNNVQERILESAEQLFCEKGFDSTSIRDITKAAECNVAAVNYYFGGKEKLYNVIFHRYLEQLRDVRIVSIDKVMSQPQATLEELIRAFSTAFLEPIMAESSGRRLIKLMVREMSDPRLPRKMFIDELVTPTVSALGGGISKLCPGIEREKIMLLILSVVGQLVHIIRIYEMFDSEEFEQFPHPSISDMVEHIVEFSAAGIRAAVKGKG